MNKNNIIMTENEFEIKCYRKSDLAHIYFPEMQQDSAVRKLMRWVKKCKGLMPALEAVNYDAQCQWLSAQEVRLIVENLGRP